MLMLLGCTKTTQLIAIDYHYSDNVAQQRIDLVYENKTKNTMCLLPEDWPNIGHKINQASDKVFLIVENKRFPIEDFNTGYCMGGCAFYVAPGEEIKASIPYDDFNLPENLFGKPKELDFKPVAYKCRKK